MSETTAVARAQGTPANFPSMIGVYLAVNAVPTPTPSLMVPTARSTGPLYPRRHDLESPFCRWAPPYLL